MVDAARRVLIRGNVQGCGLRPVLARLAAVHHWSGSVRNAPDGVELIVRGSLLPDEQLQALISANAPPSAMIDGYSCDPTDDVIGNGFQIADSITTGPLTAPLPCDRAICTECLRESFDPANRRYLYPFTTCAECGPRYSILRAMPFDRLRTSMQMFEMCAECECEYQDPHNRRFHAQTISCARCGPHLWNGRGDLKNQAALESTANALRSGQIVAIRGIGGYQLLVDATSSSAVKRLRERKRRPAKPFAVLIATKAAAHNIAHVSLPDELQLCSLANPIVLLRQRPSSSLAPEINPGLSEIGLLLPTTALHALLLNLVGRPLVCTSGNLDGEPLAYHSEDAEPQLQSVADLFLHHDREIVHPIDDSVIRVMAERPVTLRAARGIAPLQLSLPRPSQALYGTTIVACGGHQKGSFAVATGHQVLLGPHVGDLDTVTVQDRWDESVRLTRELLEPADAATALACDAHPGYFPTQWATERCQVPHVVWHHHAHVVTGMIEHGWLDREVLGVAWDGTGLGPDGTIWGGEFLRATATQFQRVANLRPFCLPGGDAAITDPRRLTVSVLSQLDELTTVDTADLLQMSVSEVNRMQQTLDSRFSPVTTSCGRLFDAVALLILSQAPFEFDGYAAMRLESACDQKEPGAYRFEVQNSEPLQLDWRPVIRQILSDRRQGVFPGMMAMRFHRGLAKLIIDVAGRFPNLPVVLGGGVFQNQILVELVASLWPGDRPPLGLPGVIPPNDGGLAVGQLAVCLATNASKET